jgi:hypothetical protein
MRQDALSLHDGVPTPGMSVVAFGAVGLRSTWAHALLALLAAERATDAGAEVISGVKAVRKPAARGGSSLQWCIGASVHQSVHQSAA